MLLLCIFLELTSSGLSPDVPAGAGGAKKRAKLPGKTVAAKLPQEALPPYSPLNEALRHCQVIDRATAIVLKVESVLFAADWRAPIANRALAGALIRFCQGDESAFKSVEGGVLCSATQKDIGSVLWPGAKLDVVLARVKEVLEPITDRTVVFASIKGNTRFNIAVAVCRMQLVAARLQLCQLILIHLRSSVCGANQSVAGLTDTKLLQAAKLHKAVEKLQEDGAQDAQPRPGAGATAKLGKDESEQSFADVALCSRPLAFQRKRSSRRSTKCQLRSSTSRSS